MVSSKAINTEGSFLTRLLHLLMSRHLSISITCWENEPTYRLVLSSCLSQDTAYVTQLTNTFLMV